MTTTPEDRFVEGLRAALAEYDAAAAKETPPGYVPDPAFEQYVEGLRKALAVYDAPSEDEGA